MNVQVNIQKRHPFNTRTKYSSVRVMFRRFGGIHTVMFGLHECFINLTDLYGTILYIILFIRFVNWLSDVRLITADKYVLVVAS